MFFFKDLFGCDIRNPNKVGRPSFSSTNDLKEKLNSQDALLQEKILALELKESECKMLNEEIID